MNHAMTSSTATAGIASQAPYASRTERVAQPSSAITMMNVIAHAIKYAVLDMARHASPFLPVKQ